MRFIKVTVNDTGCGIDPDIMKDLTKIFNTFNNKNNQNP